MMHNTGQLQDTLGKGWPDWGSPWHDTYQCADGNFITVCALEPQFYQVLIEKLGLTENPTFANQWDKSLWPQGKAEFQAIFRGKSRQQWCELLEGTDACFAPVKRILVGKDVKIVDIIARIFPSAYDRIVARYV